MADATDRDGEMMRKDEKKRANAEEKYQGNKTRCNVGYLLSSVALWLPG